MSKTIQVRVPLDLYERLRDEAIRQGMTLSEYIRRAIARPAEED